MPGPGRSLLIAALVALAALAGAGSARASGFAPLVPRGGVRLPAGSRDAGPLRGGAEVRATVALRARHAAGLAAYATAVSTPGSPDYRRYLSVAQFRARFAPRTGAVRALAAHLRGEGLVVGRPTANGLALPIHAAARVMDDALSTSMQRFVTPGGQTGAAPTSPPRLGRAGDGLVQGVVGLDTVAPTAAVRVGRRLDADRAKAATGKRNRKRIRKRTRASATAAGPRPCAAARSAAASGGSLTADEVAARYGLENFQAAGDEGAGMTIGVYELEPFSAADVASFQACMGTSTSLSVESVDGGPGGGTGTGEAAMDVEDLIGLAPQAQIRVYEGPPTGTRAYDTYAAIVSDDAASIVSTSWGLCESEQGAAAAAAEDVLFQEAAAQGQTILAASGDNGADDCGDGAAGADDPAAQPWVTAVGGTEAGSAGDTVWNSAMGASGGGASRFWARPAWQTAFQPQTSVSCGAAGTACRELPDISADADPSTGYTAFFRGAWHTVGGTSVAAPTVAALAALANASPACAGRRLGFLDPALYRNAANIRDVTSGSNSFAGVPGFAAGPGYDMASGLGTPTSALGPALCGDSLTLATPAAPRWAKGRRAALALRATSARGAAISFSATGLPSGLSIDSATGHITGTPTASGRFTVAVTALDRDGATATVSFTTTVSRARKAGHSSSHRTGAIVVGGARRIRGRVGRAVHGRVHARDGHGLALRYAAVGLPHGVKIGARTGVIAGTPRAAGHAAATIRVSDVSGATRTEVVHWRITRGTTAGGEARRLGRRTSARRERHR